MRGTIVSTEQIIYLFVWRASQTLFYQCIFPFVGSQLVDLGIANAEEVGHYSGPLEAVAALTCVASLPLWVELGNCFGRKPVILVGVACASVSASMFGFCQTYLGLVLCRGFTGFFNGAMAALAKTMAIEMSDSRSVARTLAWCSAGFQAGMLLGPALGGALTKPAETWPGIFKDTIFGQRFPYALAPLAVAIVPFTFCLVGIGRVRETLPAQDRVASKCSPLRPYLGVFGLVKEAKTPNIWTRPMIYMLGLICMLEILIVSVLQLEVLLFFEPRHLGGLGWTPQQMAVYMIIRPLALGVYDVRAFPYIHKRFGIAKIFHYLSGGFVLLYATFFLASTAAMHGAPDVVVYTLLAGMLCLTIISSTVFLGKDSAVADRALTKTLVPNANAASETSSQLGVAIGTTMSSNLFAFVLRLHPNNGGREAYVIMMLFSAAVAMYASHYTDIDGWRNPEGEEIISETLDLLHAVNGTKEELQHSKD